MNMPSAGPHRVQRGVIVIGRTPWSIKGDKCETETLHRFRKWRQSVTVSREPERGVIEGAVTPRGEQKSHLNKGSHLNKVSYKRGGVGGGS